MTDHEFMLRCLQERPHTSTELRRRSERERGAAFLPNNRASDLRKRGHDVRCERIGTRDGRGIYLYELVEHPVQLALPA